ncbi:MAG: cobalt ECF transporter T component CbiQ [Desulfovibrio sp.]
MTSFAEEFADGHSIVHTITPRIRLIVATLFSCAVATFANDSAALAALIAGALLALLAKLPIKPLVKRLIVINVFVVFLWVFLPFTTEGTPLRTFGPLVASVEGVHLAKLLTLKANAIMLTFITLGATMTVSQFGRAMQRLGIPDKLCHLLLFTFRYIFVIEQEFKKMTRALKARGFAPRTNMHTWRTYSYLVGMLLVKSYDRAEQVYKAMVCRGFDGTFYTLEKEKLSGLDYSFLLSGCITTAGLVILEYNKAGLIWQTLPF